MIGSTTTCYRQHEVELLIRRGAKVDVRDHLGYTALMYAVDKGQLENVRPLLAHHADPNIRANDGATALSRAGTYPETSNHGLTDDDWDQCIRLLRRAGAK